MKCVVLVEPEVPENTGFIARLSDNFDSELRIVNPEFNLSEARKTASRAQQKLTEAKIFDQVDEAVEDLNFVVGTKPGRGQSLSSFKARGDTSLMVGRESSGLTNQELDLCDAVVRIETGDYSSINQSHAAAILMHNFYNSEAKYPGITQGQKEKLREMIQIPELRDLVKQANPSEDKVNNIIGQIKKEKSQE